MDHSRVYWLFIVKTKPRSRVQVVQDGNDEVIAGDDVFQLDELVNPCRVASSTDLKENSNFCIVEITFVDVDVELNDILRTNEHTKVNKDDDNDEINVEDCDGDDNDEFEEEEEEDNSD